MALTDYERKLIQAQINELASEAKQVVDGVHDRLDAIQRSLTESQTTTGGHSVQEAA